MGIGAGWFASRDFYFQDPVTFEPTFGTVNAAGAVIAANERSAVSAVSASTPPRDASAGAVTNDTRAGARDALEAQETRKLARERRLREIRGAASSRRGSDEPAFVFGDARSQSRDELSGKRAVDSSAELDASSRVPSKVEIFIISATTLARAGMLDAKDDGVLARADRMFATAYRPHCPDGF